MSTAVLQQRQVTAPRPIHNGRDELFLYARTKEIAGTPVTTPDFEADLHVETTTIMFADVVESVRLIEQDEIGNVTRIRRLITDLAETVIPAFSGTLLERRGDGLLVKFRDSRRAASCALAIQAHCADSQGRAPHEPVLAMRIGLHGAEVLSDDIAIYGRGINVAARVTSLANPGETFVSGSVRDLLVPGLDGDLEDMGERYVKNDFKPMHVFRLSKLRSQVSPLLNVPVAVTPLPIVAVLPFDVGVDAEAQTAADLLAEALLQVLSRCDNIQVISWHSSKVFRGRDLRGGAAASALGAHWIVAGSFSVVSQRVVTRVELMDSDELVSWSSRAVGDVDDLLLADSLIAAELAQGIAQNVADGEAKRVLKHPLPTLQSHSLLTGAISLMHRSSHDNFVRSREAFEHLLERHSRMHGVRPWLAQWYVLNTTRGYVHDPAGDASRALDQTSRALDSQPSDSFSQAMQGFVYCHLKKDLLRADRLLAAAVETNPNESLAWLFRTTVRGAMGQHADAWSAAQIALRLAPFDPQRHYFLSLAAGAAYFAGMGTEAMNLSREAMRINAVHSHTLRILLYTLVESGQLAEARLIAEKLMQLDPGLNVRDFKQRSIQSFDVRARLADNLLRAGIPN